MENSENTHRNQVSNNSIVDNSKLLPRPSNHLALAIFTTICCCLPFGIFAIIKANSVNKLYQNGEYRYAYIASNDAKKMCVHGIILGLVANALSSISGSSINYSGINYINVLFSNIFEVFKL